MDKTHENPEDAPPDPMRGRKRRFRVFVLVWLVFALPIFWWIHRSTQPARAAGHAFLNALDKGDFSRAFAFCAPKLRRQIGTDGNLQTLVERSHGLYCPTFWTSAQLQGDVADLDSKKDKHTREEYSVHLRLRKSGGKWLVISMNSRTRRALCNCPLSVCLWRRGFRHGNTSRVCNPPAKPGRRWTPEAWAGRLVGGWKMGSGWVRDS